MDQVLRSFALFFGLLNPFLMSVYLLQFIEALPQERFARVLIRAVLISGGVFSVFAWGGEALFSDVLQLRLASFQVFGGILFLLIGIRFVLSGVKVVGEMRGDPQVLNESAALPFMIGPGTVSASIIVGNRHPVGVSVALIFVTLALTAVTLMVLKLVHDRVRRRNVALVDRYVEVVGRLSGFFVGTVSVEMILVGLQDFLQGG